VQWRSRSRDLLTAPLESGPEPALAWACARRSRSRFPGLDLSYHRQAFNWQEPNVRFPRSTGQI